MSRAIYLKAILAFGIVSTGIHFTHNFVKIDDYPESPIPDWVVQTAIVVSWPIFTWIAVRAYRLYTERGLEAARPWLLWYAAWTLFSLGHFTEGNPDIPPVFYATIFTDVLAGVLVVAFVVLGARRSRRPATA
jgi:multisubunit Na+/H+ antiporter MnhC subunit